MILDLFTNVDYFDSYLPQWTVMSATSTSITPTTISCGMPSLGGPGITVPGGYIERTYTSLPSHSTLLYSIIFFAIGSWNPTDSIFLHFDDLQPLAWTHTQLATTPLTTQGNLCGLSTQDIQFNLVGQVSHSSSSLRLRVKSSLTQNSNLASFAIADVRLALSTSIIPIVQGSCINSFGQAFTDQNLCPLKNSGHQDGFQGSSCHSSCKFCYGTNANQCYACIENKGTYDGTSCRQPCSSSICKFCSKIFQNVHFVLRAII